MPPQETLTQDQYHQIYTAIWQNIAREDNNIASRIGWGIGLSTGLFSAISFMVPRINDYNSGIYWPPTICLIIFGMATLGLFFSLRTKVGVEAAHTQISYLRGHYAHFASQFQGLCLPRPFGDSSHGAGRRSSAIYPVALLFFWSVILFASFTGTAWTFVRAASYANPATAQGASSQPFAKSSTAPNPR